MQSQISTIAAALNGRVSHGGAICRCPAHGDGSPSLSVRAGHTSLLVHCFAGCDSVDVIESLRDLGLWPGGRGRRSRSRSRRGSRARADVVQTEPELMMSWERAAYGDPLAVKSELDEMWQDLKSVQADEAWDALVQLDTIYKE